MSTSPGKGNQYNRSVTAVLDYISAPPARGVGIGEATYFFVLGART
jgi:hypothetical protein